MCSVLAHTCWSMKIQKGCLRGPDENTGRGAKRPSLPEFKHVVYLPQPFTHHPQQWYVMKLGVFTVALF